MSTAPTTTPARPRSRRLAPTDLALVAFFAALIAACAVLPGIPVGQVPITLQTLAIGLAAAVLGARRGLFAVLLYVALGLAGLPIFAGGAGGLAVLAGPSVGYIVAWPFATVLSGWLVQRLRRRSPLTSVPLVAASLFAGSVVFIHPLGIVGLALRIPGFSLADAILADLVFWPGDVVKCVLAAVVAVAVHRAFPDLLPRR